MARFIASRALAAVDPAWHGLTSGALALLRPALLAGLAAATSISLLRTLARRRRRYARVRVEPFRTDDPDPPALSAMYESLHAALARPLLTRLLAGQPSLGLEVHFSPGTPSPLGWFELTCPVKEVPLVHAALRGAYPNCRLCADGGLGVPAGALVRMRKRELFIGHLREAQRRAPFRPPPVDALLTAMAATGQRCCLQLALTPAPVGTRALARSLQRSRERRARELRGSVSLQESRTRPPNEVLGGPFFFADIRVLGSSVRASRAVGGQLRAHATENPLRERPARLSHGILHMYRRRLERGEGNPLPSLRHELYAPSELAGVWQLPSREFAAVPVARCSVPVAPAPPAVLRAPEGQGMLRDEHGPVSIPVQLRRQNVAVPGTVEQGKSSFLIATVAEDLRRERCSVIVLDPKGDAADAAVSLVPPERTCTVLDFAHPTCGFNPLAVDAPADVIADYVVGALRNLFSDADIRASSDRYLRNAVIAVLAHDRAGTLWDAARLLSVGEDGYAFRRAVAGSVRALPEFKEISEFFTAELTAQLADSRATTTSKLDAPVNKLARLLNSPSIKRILLNRSLTLDFDSIISGCEVLVVKGALGAMGAGNTSVMMQLLVGMLDAALARQQDLVGERERIAVALKIDEAPLVLNRGFAETMALKRSAGLETVACWQTDAQWTEREVREQLDALFAHRVYFATASAHDARSAAALTMREFSDTVRAGQADAGILARPDVRLHLPKHCAIASWTSAEGRQAAFVARTIPMRVEPARLALHAELQRARGGRHLEDLRQPHWQARAPAAGEGSAFAGRADTSGAAESAGPREGALAQTPPPVRSALGRVPTPRSTPGGEPSSRATPAKPGATAAVPNEGYRELVEVDRAPRARWPPPPARLSPLKPDATDLEILALIGAFGHVLSSQLHRYLHPGRAPSTTQRRLKRLANAGLVARLQFHRSDGGGVPMCYLLTPPGRELLGEGGGGAAAAPAPARLLGVEGGGANSQAIRQARRELHVAGYVIAIAAALGLPRSALRGPSQSVLEPPRRAGGTGDTVIGPAQLRLPGGCAPHDFLRSLPDGTREEVDRFQTLRPHATIESAGGDLLVEFDDRLPRGRDVGKLERYDHFLTGWALHTARYGPRRGISVRVLFVCRDRARARELARAADPLVVASRAYAGEYPQHWAYPGRAGVLFASERDAHHGDLNALALEPLPPQVRIAAQRDARAAQASPQHCRLDN